VDTGLDTMTGGRLRRIKDFIKNEDAFCFTYGDGLSDVNIEKLIDLHKKEKKLATVTAVQPPGRFGSIKFQGNQVSAFQEKPKGDGSWINGGYFVLSPKVIDYIADDETTWEQNPMCQLAKKGEMSCYFHEGFWQAMDTLREKTMLEQMWNEKKAPWKLWK
jgi:glucose-1-phosphate cytidylyltransferase